MELQFAVIENYLMVRMPKEVDHHESAKISKTADEYILKSRIKNVVFDFEATRFMDSSGIGIVIGRARKLKFFEDGEVAVCNMSKRVDVIFKSAGLYDIVKKEEK